jgi:hypothetical protein
VTHRRFFMCPECANGAFTPFRCGGAHANIRKDGSRGKRRVYRFVEAVEMRPLTEREKLRAEKLHAEVGA